jgi:EAL domain-containing protein (putative c-di-GMP-specific phosphodiesterase class I)
VHELHTSGIPPARICFEIAESAAVTHLHRAIHFIQMLKAFGCQFALDDFGSGLSAFSYLKSLPVNYLKIDGSILKSLAKEPVDYAMVESTHHIAKAMGIKSIAKLVETDEVLKQLRQIGIDYGQGFALHVPESIVFPVKH